MKYHNIFQMTNFYDTSKFWISIINHNYITKLNIVTMAEWLLTNWEDTGLIHCTGSFLAIGDLWTFFYRISRYNLKIPKNPNPVPISRKNHKHVSRSNQIQGFLSKCNPNQMWKQIWSDNIQHIFSHGLRRSLQYCSS